MNEEAPGKCGELSCKYHTFCVSVSVSLLDMINCAVQWRSCSNQCSLAGHTLQSDTTGPARLYSILGTPSIFIVGVARCVGGGACTLSFWLFIPTRTLHHRWYRQVDVRRVIIEMAEATAVEVETSQVVTQVGEVSFVWIYKSYHFTDIIGCLGIDGVATTQTQDWS